MVHRIPHRVGQKAAALRGVGRNYPLELITPRHMSGIRAISSELVVSAVGPFVALGVTFDGTNDYMENASGFSGAADSKVGCYSVWYINNSMSASEKLLSGSGGKPIEIFIDAGTNKLSVAMYDGGGTNRTAGLSNSAFTIATSWHHLMIGWDLAATTVNVRLDDVDVPMTFSVGPGDFETDWTGVTLGCGAQPGGSSKWIGDMAEQYINIATFLDPDDAATMAKFRSSDGKPVDLGVDGSTPTGSQPICYNRVADGGAAVDFDNNLGAGDDWVITGALTLASSNPSD
jgi:hypothetical protein